MKKFILSFVALLAVGTMTKAENGIVDGKLPSAMDATTNPEICTDWTYTTANFNGTGDVFPIYDDCKTNVYITLTTVGEADWHTFIYEINDDSGYATMLGNYNGWGVYTMKKPDPYIYTTIPGNYVISAWKEDNGVKFTVTSDQAGKTTTAWDDSIDNGDGTYGAYIQEEFPDQEWFVVPPTGDNGAGGTYSGVVTAFHMGGEACSYTITGVDFEVSTNSGSVTINDTGWWSQEAISLDDLFGLIDPEDATYIEFTSDASLFYVAFNDAEGGWTQYDCTTGSIIVNVSEIDFSSMVAQQKYDENGDAVYDENGDPVYETDENGDVIMGLRYYLCVVVGSNTGENLTISWTVNTKEYSNAIKDIKADAVEVVEVARYNLAGQKIAGEQKGINIIKYSDGSSKKVLVK